MNLGPVTILPILVALAVAGPSPSAVADEVDPLRLSWQTFAKDPKRVESLRKGVAVMRMRNSSDKASAQYRTSWEYWASIHGYFGARARSGTVADYIEWAKTIGNWKPEFEEKFRDILDASPSDKISETTWDQCEHRSRWFFAWHRLYLSYFEKVLQDAAQDSSLRLPYWDYTDSQQLEMPAAFVPPFYEDRDGKQVANPLFTDRRSDAWIPPRKTALTANRTNVDTVLRRTRFDDFQSAIEQTTVHPYVHCAVMDCPVTAMGAVPFSANDPIFWLHHANIDRLWECWSSIAGHENPNDETFLGKTYTFVSAAGEEINVKVSALFDETLIDYQYENVDNCSRAPSPPTAPASPPASEIGVLSTAFVDDSRQRFSEGLIVAEATATLSVSGQRAAVSLSPMPLSESNKLSAQLFVFKSNPALPVRSFLTLGDIKYDQHPGAMLDVYVRSRSKPHFNEYVGTLSFFETPPSALHSHDSARSYRFDVSDVLRRLELGSADDLSIDVVVETTTGRAGDSPPATISEASNLRILGIKIVATNLE